MELPKSFFFIAKKNSEEIKDLIQNPNEHKNNVIIDQLRSSGFIIDDTFNESQYLLKKRHSEINNRHYTLMLLPTYNCNFSCWYCVQDHKCINMKIDLIDKIKIHIKTYLLKNNINVFEIAWFGGEPMMCMDRIEDVASFSKKFCSENNISFFNSITTNAYFLNTSKIKVLKDLNFISFQITIDGCKSDHDNVKFDCNSNNSSFEITMSNILGLLNSIPNARIILRFNYTANNIKQDKIIEDLNTYLPQNIRNKIEILLQKVWQINERDIDHEIVIKFKKNLIKHGYRLSNSEIHKCYGCYVERKHYNAIFPNGHIVKCNNCNLNTKGGYINNLGLIDWEVDSNYKLFEECEFCKYLPICFGNCPEKRTENDSFKEKICNNELYHLNTIIDYCENIVIQSNYKE